MKTRKHNATSRISVRQREGKKEPTSSMRPPASYDISTFRSFTHCPKDDAEVKEILNRGMQK